MTKEIIQPFAADLIARINAVPEVANNALNMYSNSEFLTNAGRLSPPLVGVIYAGMSGKEDGSKSGAAVFATFQVALVGAEACQLCLGDYSSVDKTFYLLDALRAAIVGKQAPSPGHRKWEFVSERPAKLGVTTDEDDIAYVQVYRTTAINQVQF